MKKFLLLLMNPFALFLGAPTAHAKEKTTTSVEANWKSYRPETSSGTISMVEPSTKSVFVMGSSEGSYKFLVTPKTKIEIDGTKGTIENLAGQDQCDSCCPPQRKHGPEHQRQGLRPQGLERHQRPHSLRLVGLGS
jgi:hypothetical protein